MQINWNNPADKAPPFQTEFLAVIEGDIFDVVMLTDGPNDYSHKGDGEFLGIEGSDYMAFQAGAKFADVNFHLVMSENWRLGDLDSLFDANSDKIVAWAEKPDLGAIL